MECRYLNYKRIKLFKKIIAVNPVLLYNAFRWFCPTQRYALYAMCSEADTGRLIDAKIN